MSERTEYARGLREWCLRLDDRRRWQPRERKALRHYLWQVQQYLEDESTAFTRFLGRQLEDDPGGRW